METLTNSPPKATEKTVAQSAPLSWWLGWAVFLGISWTWCIGMFLPVLLVRDYGMTGWVVFAIPNVLGAAAMGWVIKSRDQSVAITTHHRLACQLFSAVTIAFHLFFALAFIAGLAEAIVSNRKILDLAVGGIIGCSVILYVYLTRRPGAGRTLAWIVLLISLTAFGFLLPDLFSSSSSRIVEPMRSISDLIWLVPVCIFGFLGCPYLDLTFHRARQNANRPRMAFGVGFGVVFFLMIIFTLLYARLLTRGLFTPWIAIFIFVHMSVQSIFTVTAHARELRSAVFASIITGVLTIASWIALEVIRDHTTRDHTMYQLLTAEMIYRIFMGFYGLIFPAYIWLVMLPSRGGKPILQHLVLFAIAVLIAMPMFWMGFIEQKMVWLAPGLGVVLISRIFLKPFRNPCV
ncbi:MAG TPA: hypothetical protein VHD56_04115 [Tepidisphaeraceae bacterium]|nr:hypothetical protein [Tepidisphaeraceae bacterium]